MTVAKFATDNLANTQRVEVLPTYLTPAGNAFTSEQLATLFPSMTFATRAQIGLTYSSSRLAVEWSGDNGAVGQVLTTPSLAASPSELVPDPQVGNWREFREHCTGLEPGRWAYRGQGRPWRLRTAFHREGRSDLLRYASEDVHAVHRELVARTRHLFDLNNDWHYGAFLNLIQHRGYPTPLLDWSYSPFVAAYFAFQTKRDKHDDAPVRIVLFDQRQWREDFSQMQRLAHLPPHVSVLNALAIENDRAIPQQALSTVTNLDDIEGYLRMRERERGRTYLKAIDLPYSERAKVIRELGMMGITPASLFPGLDGACQDLKYRLFDQAGSWAVAEGEPQPPTDEDIVDAIMGQSVAH